MNAHLSKRSLLYVAAACGLFLVADLTFLPGPTVGSSTTVSAIRDRMLRIGVLRDGGWITVRRYVATIAEEVTLRNENRFGDEWMWHEDAGDEYGIELIISYRWGGFLHRTWYEQIIDVQITPSPQATQLDPALEDRIRMAMAQDLLDDPPNRRPHAHLPQVMRSGETTWRRRVWIGHAQDALTLIALIGFAASLIALRRARSLTNEQ